MAGIVLRPFAGVMRNLRPESGWPGLLAGPSRALFIRRTDRVDEGERGPRGPQRCRWTALRLSITAPISDVVGWMSQANQPISTEARGQVL